MKSLRNIVVKLTLVLTLLSLNACGDAIKDSSLIRGSYEQAVAVLTLTGGTDTIGSLQFDLILPAGFSLKTYGSELATGVLTVNIAGTTVATHYLPEDLVNFGQLTLGVIKADGFSAGTIATLFHDLGPTETLPAVGSFTIANLQVTDLSGAALPGYSISIALQQQTVIP